MVHKRFIETINVIDKIIGHYVFLFLNCLLFLFYYANFLMFSSIVSVLVASQPHVEIIKPFLVLPEPFIELTEPVSKKTMNKQLRGNNLTLSNNKADQIYVTNPFIKRNQEVYSSLHQKRQVTENILNPFKQSTTDQITLADARHNKNHKKRINNAKNHTKAGTVRDPFYQKAIIDVFPLLPSEVKTLKKLYLNKKIKTGDNIQEILSPKRKIFRSRNNENKQSNEKQKNVRYLLNRDVSDEKLRPNNIIERKLSKTKRKLYHRNQELNYQKGIGSKAYQQSRKNINIITLSRSSVNLPARILVNALHTTTIVFIDHKGNPWPIKQFAFGKPDDFNIKLAHGMSKNKTKNDYNNILLIKNKKKFALANLVVTLRSAQEDSMTFVFTLDTLTGGQDLVTQVKIID